MSHSAGRVLALHALLAGCRAGPKPWESDAGNSDDLFTTRPSVVVTSSAARLAEPATEHERCTAGYVASGDPVRDVTRLGLSCGGATGMRRALPLALTGRLGEGPVELALTVKKGRCYRVFGAASPVALDLDLGLRTSRDSLVAEDRTKGPLAFLGARGPVCGLEEGEVTVLVSGAGRGSFALEVWEGPDRSPVDAGSERR